MALESWRVGRIRAAKEQVVRTFCPYWTTGAPTIGHELARKSASYPTKSAAESTPEPIFGPRPK